MTRTKIVIASPQLKPDDADAEGEGDGEAAANWALRILTVTDIGCLQTAQPAAAAPLPRVCFTNSRSGPFSCRSSAAGGFS